MRLASWNGPDTLGGRLARARPQARQPIPLAGTLRIRIRAQWDDQAFLDTHQLWRRANVTEQRTARDLPYAVLSTSLLRSGSFWTVSRRIPPARFVRPARRRRPYALCDVGTPLHARAGQLAQMAFKSTGRSQPSGLTPMLPRRSQRVTIACADALEKTSVAARMRTIAAPS
jgi:hypothetical protein